MYSPAFFQWNSTIIKKFLYIRSMMDSIYWIYCHRKCIINIYFIVWSTVYCKYFVCGWYFEIFYNKPKLILFKAMNIKFIVELCVKKLSKLLDKISKSRLIKIYASKLAFSFCTIFRLICCDSFPKGVFPSKMRLSYSYFKFVL